MNIKTAKSQIKDSIKAYYAKDSLGNYLIPVNRQRPIFLIGAPGIGKTAIMEQIAAEMGIGLLSYSMTHHTRQSALGLPFIKHKVFGGKEFDVSEYTMSEIIASIYDLMEETGVKEGILFLDEINCVSETLTPVMLQFLQYKVFGRHKVPDGWVVVTAGNPPEYNRSVRDFDIVTLDRLKPMKVEPSFPVWQEYAYSVGIHPSIMTYLESKPDHFYSVETTVSGHSFVTARGWDDLSRMIRVYESMGKRADLDLISQYLQNEEIARSFANYYDLFTKYESSYQINDILEGKANNAVKQNAQKAELDERFALVGMMIDSVLTDVKKIMNEKQELIKLRSMIVDFKNRSAANEKDGKTSRKLLEEIANEKRTAIIMGIMLGSMPQETQAITQSAIISLQRLYRDFADETDHKKMFDMLKENYNKLPEAFEHEKDRVVERMNNMFLFCEEVFGSGQEILVIVTDLTASPDAVAFISSFGCEQYFRFNKELAFYERNREMMKALDKLGIWE